MDLVQFRGEVRDWLDANAPPGVRDLSEGGDHLCWGGRRWSFANDDQRLWLERAIEKRWTVPDWPVAYGGAGLSHDEAAIIHQEMRRLRIRKPLESLGIWMLGPALLRFGSQAQKLEHLPRIARGEIRWAQGYSEPGAGSDLASLSMRCTDEGGHWLVDGEKTWTSYGDSCDWIFALVRTQTDGPKQQGISFLLIDMETPGVSTTPIKLISGASPFTSTIFDNVRVPKDNMVGAPGQGWAIAKYLLGHEREMIGAFPAVASAPLSAIAAEAFEQDAIASTDLLRGEIARCEADAWALEIYMERVKDLARVGDAPAVSGSVIKLFGTELAQRRAATRMTLSGLDGLIEGSNASAEWLHAPIGRIAGGSNEIQLNVIAKRALGLPEI